MTFRTGLKTTATLGLAFAMTLSTQAATMAQAEMLTTEQAISSYAAYADRSFLLSELQRDEIRAEIIALGVDPAEAEARLQALTDEEVASLVMQIEDGSAGADGLVGALLTVFVVLLITDILCFTKVFNFTRCAN